MTDGKYFFPSGGLPQQKELLTGRSVFKESYALIAGEVMTDIVVSFFPNWNGARAWLLSCPIKGFSETFSQSIVEVFPSGGSKNPEIDDNVECVLFVVDGNLEIQISGTVHSVDVGSYVYIPAKTTWKIKNRSNKLARFHWIRKKYEKVEGLKYPQPFVVKEFDIKPHDMPDTGGLWSTTRFVDPNDLRHDMHVNIVNLKPGAVIPFMETHIMEHGIYILQGKGVYRLNEDWVEVKAGDFIWLRRFCPQACYAGGPEDFRYILYKDVNRQVSLK